MQAKISIQLIAPDKATKQSRFFEVLIYIHIIEVQVEEDLKAQGNRTCVRTTRLMRLLTVTATSYKLAIIISRRRLTLLPPYELELELELELGLLVWINAELSRWF